MNKNLAIITARGGSKRIPRKNIKYFFGKPIIEYSIAAALESKIFDEVMVSTDDVEIADIAKACGASIPFFRSNSNSDDFSTTADVLFEVLSEYQAHGRLFNNACCIYPTAPFVTPDKIKNSFSLLKGRGVDTVFPVASFSYPIQRALKIDRGFLAMINPQHVNSRSQDLSPAYHDAGQFYWLKVEKFLKTKSLFSECSAPFVISELEVQDIDTEQDWMLAEAKFKLMKQLN
jgi:pseudaminic acid cytidylyltransferase